MDIKKLGLRHFLILLLPLQNSTSHRRLCDTVIIFGYLSQTTSLSISTNYVPSFMVQVCHILSDLYLLFLVCSRRVLFIPDECLLVFKHSHNESSHIFLIVNELLLSSIAFCDSIWFIVLTLDSKFLV